MSAELRRLAEGATPGPWTAHSDGLVWRTDDAPGDPVSGSTEYEDAAYIAAASPDVVLALLEERDRLRWIVKLTDLYLRRYGLANTSGERHDDRKERVRDLRGEIAALPAVR